jgi:hypothetical protein
MNFDYIKNKISFKAGLGFQDLSDADKALARQLTSGNAGSLLRTFESAADPLYPDQFSRQYQTG